jgi:hypothetical protein
MPWRGRKRLRQLFFRAQLRQRVNNPDQFSDGF